MEGYGGPAQPSPTIGQCLTAGWAGSRWNAIAARPWASLPLDAIRRPRDTPIWKLEASLKRRSCRRGRWTPPVRINDYAALMVLATTLPDYRALGDRLAGQIEAFAKEHGVRIPGPQV